MVLLPLIENIISVRYDFIRVIIFCFIHKYCSLIKRMLWLMVSNAAGKLSKISII